MESKKYNSSSALVKKYSETARFDLNGMVIHQFWGALSPCLLGMHFLYQCTPSSLYAVTPMQVMDIVHDLPEFFLERTAAA